jgi:hypothetical protein
MAAFAGTMVVIDLANWRGFTSRRSNPGAPAGTPTGFEGLVGTAPPVVNDELRRSEINDLPPQRT